ncbi:MAG: OmpH family outer membrane protein [Planctomycetota bacterium]|nr:OmpH family outer membrane protein [Planctomycetaceae bacterium]MDQ3329128.1 OmpH family outer membrane protein [Planctomycetota bacterium]
MKSPFRYVLAGAALLASASPIVASAQGTANTRPARPTTGAAAPADNGTIQQTAGTAPSAAELPHKVGLVDVGHIFTNYEKLKDRRDRLQKEIESSDGELKSIQEQIQGIQAQLKSVTKGSDAATQLEQQLTELNAQGQAKMSNLRREFVRKEVAMYKDIYDEVAQTVAAYANARGRNYTLILRYQRDPSAEAGDDPNKIMAKVNQLVVYHQDADDITDTILSFMNTQYRGQTAARPAAGTTPAPRRN